MKITNLVWTLMFMCCNFMYGVFILCYFSLIIILHGSVVFIIGWSFSALLQNTLSYWHQAAGTMAVWWAYIVTTKGSYTQTIFLFAFVVHIIFWTWTRWCTCDASTLGWISIRSANIHFGWWVFVGWVARFLYQVHFLFLYCVI